MQNFSKQSDDKNIVLIFLNKWILNSEIMLTALSQGTENDLRSSTSSSVLTVIRDRCSDESNLNEHKRNDKLLAHKPWVLLRCQSASAPSLD